MHLLPRMAEMKQYQLSMSIVAMKERKEKTAVNFDAMAGWNNPLPIGQSKLGSAPGMEQGLGGERKKV